jgi:hypothetical protein
MAMDLLRQTTFIINGKERNKMKNFTKLQITALAVLSTIVVSLAIAAFTTENSLSSELLTANISTVPTATSKILQAVDGWAG